MATMAANGSSSGSPDDKTNTTTERLPMPSRNPLPLSASQEAQVRDIFYDRVRRQCADEIKGKGSLVFLGCSVYSASLPASAYTPLASSLLSCPVLSCPVISCPQPPPPPSPPISTTNGRASLTIGTTLSAPPDTAFAECALGRTFSVPFACRQTHRAMNGCMKAHATPQEQDAAREDWFAQRSERARQRAEKLRRKEEQARFMREWWGLEESEREAARRRADEEKMRRGERVGGWRSGGGGGSKGGGPGSALAEGEGGRR